MILIVFWTNGPCRVTLKGCKANHKLSTAVPHSMGNLKKKLLTDGSKIQNSKKPVGTKHGKKWGQLKALKKTKTKNLGNIQDVRSVNPHLYANVSCLFSVFMNMSFSICLIEMRDYFD